MRTSVHPNIVAHRAWSWRGCQWVSGDHARHSLRHVFPSRIDGDRSIRWAARRVLGSTTRRARPTEMLRQSDPRVRARSRPHRRAPREPGHAYESADRNQRSRWNLDPLDRCEPSLSERDRGSDERGAWRPDRSRSSCVVRRRRHEGPPGRCGRRRARTPRSGHGEAGGRGAAGGGNRLRTLWEPRRRKVLWELWWADDVASPRLTPQKLGRRRPAWSAPGAAPARVARACTASGCIRRRPAVVLLRPARSSRIRSR